LVERLGLKKVEDVKVKYADGGVEEKECMVWLGWS
jgi:hypothetical protein